MVEIAGGRGDLKRLEPYRLKLVGKRWVVLFSTKLHYDKKQFKGSVDEELENALDNFARTYNLTTQNVKNIIYVSDISYDFFDLYGYM